MNSNSNETAEGASLSDEKLEAQMMAEGDAAGKAKVHIDDCPYIFANAGVSPEEYVRGDWRQRFDAWFAGWVKHHTWPTRRHNPRWHKASNAPSERGEPR